MIKQVLFVFFIIGFVQLSFAQIFPIGNPSYFNTFGQTNTSTVYTGFNGSIVVPDKTNSIGGGFSIAIGVAAINGQGAAFYLHGPSCAPQIAISTSNSSSVATEYQDFTARPGDVISFWSQYSNGFWTISMQAPGQKVASLGPKSIPNPSTLATVSMGGEVYDCGDLPSSGYVDVTADFITNGEQNDYLTSNTAQGKVKCHVDITESAPSFQFTFDTSSL